MLGDDAVDGRDGAVRTSKEDWLALAIRALVDDGIDRVKVQIIARKLNVSRSSFYWFFKSTDDLHDQMLEHWLRKNTGPIIERAMRPARTIVQGILSVFECWVDGALFDPELDIAVRLWARRSGTVKTVVAQADAQRLDALSKMFMRHGYDAEDATIRARVLYFTQIGHYTLDYPEDMKDRVAHVAAWIRAFSGCEASQDDLKTFLQFARKLHPQI